MRALGGSSVAFLLAAGVLTGAGTPAWAGATTTTTTATTGGAATTTVTRLTQSQAAPALSAAGIRWSSSGGCTTRSNPRCTSLEQVDKTTVDGVITLKRASGCSLTITGGTEVGVANRGDGYPQWKPASGNDYCDEGSHGDVTYFTCGGCTV